MKRRSSPKVMLHLCLFLKNTKGKSLTNNLGSFWKSLSRCTLVFLLWRPLLKCQHMLNFSKISFYIKGNLKSWNDNMITLLKKYSAILQNKLPPKLNDLENFSIPYVISKKSFNKTLYDLGASINLMSLSIYKRLELEKLKLIVVTLQLANRLIK